MLVVLSEGTATKRTGAAAQVQRAGLEKQVTSIQARWRQRRAQDRVQRLRDAVFADKSSFFEMVMRVQGERLVEGHQSHAVSCLLLQVTKDRRLT